MFAIPLAAQKQIFSTYDWTQSVGEVQFAEVWADVKTPGGFPEFGATPDSRRTYAVGTIEVRDARPNVLFSQSPAQPHDQAGFFLSAVSKRQVVIVQSNRTSDNGIDWQTFLFGSTITDPNARAMNARAISVWEATDPQDARIAVCGETFDQIVPKSQAPGGWSTANTNHPSGFISVLDGLGNLLWSFHFFAGTNPDLDCAVTDLSIRVDAEGNEIVTYCGISTHGLATSGTTFLDPILPFSSLAPGVTSGGDTNQGTGQWDAFVGRLVRTGVTTTRQFHSILGGPGTDGAFGLAEVEPDIFAVTGFTETTLATSTSFFPLLIPGGVTGPYRRGFVTVFDARTIASGLKIYSSDSIGSGSTGHTTFPRDISVGTSQLSGTTTPYKLYIAGSTNDPGANSGFVLVNGALQGASDGFVAVGVLDPSIAGPSTVSTLAFSFWGGEGEDGITGVNNWNEFPDQFATVGFTDGDIGVSSWLHNETFGYNTPPSHPAPQTGGLEIIKLRTAILGASNGVDRPAAIGAVSATSSTPFDTGGLGQESGGGVAVGNDGRVNIVGMSDGTNYPVIGSGSRSNDASRDAVRSELDMVLQPTASTTGVGRTDGTGFQPATAFPPRSAGLVTFTGGTTPTCALKPFGRRIGEPAPPLQRMLIEFEGNAPTSTTSDASILVTRPSSILGTAVVQINLPPATPFATIGGVDFWLGDPSAQNALFVYVGIPVTFRMPLPPITVPGIFSVQLICLLAGTTTFGPGCISDFAASPALFFGV